MRKFFVIFLFFIFIDGVRAGKLIVSKRNIDTGNFVSDCDFLIYNDSGNIVDSWVQGNSSHFSDLENGTYELVSRPYVMGAFNDDFKSSYMLNVSDNLLKLTIYNQEIDVPDNLGRNSNFIFGFLFIIFGGYFCCKY